MMKNKAILSFKTLLIYGSFAAMAWLPRITLADNDELLRQLAQAANKDIIAGNYDSAYKKAKSLKTEAIYENNQKQVANALSLIGRIFYHLSDFTGSLDFHSQALTIYQYLGDATKVATELDAISHIHLQLEDYPTALKFSEKAAQQLNKISNEPAVKAKIITNHGYILLKNLEIDKAKQQFDLAEKVITQNSLHRYFVYYLLMRSEVARSENHFEQAISYLEQAINNANKLNLSELVFAAKLELAKIHFEQAQYQQAIEFLNSELNQLKNMYRLDIQESTHKVLSDSYKALGNYQKALEHKDKEYQLHTAYADILTRQHKNVLAIESELGDNKQRVADLKRHHQQQLNELKNQYRIRELIFIAVILSLFGGYTIIYFKYKQLKKTIT